MKYVAKTNGFIRVPVRLKGGLTAPRSREVVAGEVFELPEGQKVGKWMTPYAEPEPKAKPESKRSESK
jgi:hypothetical protein